MKIIYLPCQSKSYRFVVELDKQGGVGIVRQREVDGRWLEDNDGGPYLSRDNMKQLISEWLGRYPDEVKEVFVIADSIRYLAKMFPVNEEHDKIVENLVKRKAKKPKKRSLNKKSKK